MRIPPGTRALLSPSYMNSILMVMRYQHQDAQDKGKQSTYLDGTILDTIKNPSPGTEFLLRVIEAMSRIFSTLAPSTPWLWYMDQIISEKYAVKEQNDK